MKLTHAMQSRYYATRLNLKINMAAINHDQAHNKHRRGHRRGCKKIVYSSFQPFCKPNLGKVIDYFISVLLIFMRYGTAKSAFSYQN